MSVHRVPSNDPIQKLFREALHLQAQTKLSLKAKAEQLLQEYHDQVHNEANWLPNGIVTVIHTSEEGVQTTIGMFQELKNKYVKNGRRLVPIQTDESPAQPSKSEFVEGNFWLCGPPAPVEPNYHADPVEQQQIRDYIKRTSPLSLTQALRDMQVEKILHELLHSTNIIWQRI